MKSHYRTSAISLVIGLATTVFSAFGQTGQNSNDGQILHVGGDPTEGMARPPLYLNLKPAGSSGPSTPYIPSQVRHAYGVDRLNLDGSGQVIAIVDAYGNQNVQADLNAFCDRTGIARTTVVVLGSNLGGNGNGWDLETSLDVQWAHAIAPKATILLSVAKTASLADLLLAVDAAVNSGANVVSMSWGTTEFWGSSALDSHFNKTRVTFTASSGDEGAAVEWPAVSPYVIGVGGTSLYLDTQGNVYSPEIGWSGSGGGASRFVVRPSWQLGWHAAAGRGVPDVSYAADPNTGFLVCCSTYNISGNWWQVGGTSAGAPQWAALIALSNQAGNKSAGSSAALTRLYSLAKGPKIASGPYKNYWSVNSTYLYDVTQGSNGNQQTAASPYDFVVGLGTPVVQNLIPRW